MQLTHTIGMVKDCNIHLNFMNFILTKQIFLATKNWKKSHIVLRSILILNRREQGHFFPLKYILIKLKIKIALIHSDAFSHSVKF